MVGLRQAIEGAVSMSAAAVADSASVVRGLRGDEPDDWDPDYIRRTLPLMRSSFNAYFRGEVRGLDNIPADGPSLLVGNHSGGTYIADTFVFATCFYEHFGPDRPCAGAPTRPPAARCAAWTTPRPPPRRCSSETTPAAPTSPTPSSSPRASTSTSGPTAASTSSPTTSPRGCRSSGSSAATACS